MDSTSASLLQRLQTDPCDVAWERFVELYVPLIYHWVRKSGVPADDVADCVQEVLLRLLDKLPRFRYDPGQSFRAWLRTVTQNQCRDHLRRRKSAAPRQTLFDGDEQTSPDHVQLFTDREYRQLVSRRALRLMQDEFETSTWQACWDQVVLGETASVVAQRLGITTNAAYLAKSRVLRRLREELRGLLE